jgi:sugar phosphate isomerase/epimerase
VTTTTDWPLSYCTLDRSPLFGMPETLHEQATAAAAAGFVYITIDMFALREYVAARHSISELADHLAAVGIQAYDIAGTNVSADPDASRQEATELAGYAQGLGAPWLQSRITAPLDDDRTLDTFRECAAIAASLGVGLGLEFSPFTPINGLGRAREVLDEVRSAGSPRQGIVVDSWHLAYTDGFDPLLRLPAADLAFVQLDDAAPGAGTASSDTMHRRAMPGEGVLGLDAFMDALRTIGFSGVLTVEVLSSELRALPLDDYVARTYASTTALIRPPA